MLSINPVQSVSNNSSVIEKQPIELKNKSNLGEDNLILFFKITKKADLIVKCFDIKDEFLGEYNLGNIF